MMMFKTMKIIKGINKKYFIKTPHGKIVLNSSDTTKYFLSIDQCKKFIKNSIKNNKWFSVKGKRCE